MARVHHLRHVLVAARGFLHHQLGRGYTDGYALGLYAEMGPSVWGLGNIHHTGHIQKGQVGVRHGAGNVCVCGVCIRKVVEIRCEVMGGSR